MMTAAKLEEGSASDREKCVVMVMDEMYIKEDLVYNKHTGALVGFANLGDTNEHLVKFQQTIEASNSDDRQPLAKTMLVFMVRGLLSSLQYPYVQFACRSVTGEQLFDLFWEAVYRLERMGLRVLAATADGASTNRRLFSLHRQKRGELTYKVHNPYASDIRFLYFFSDPPHLMKTVRNAWASSKRQMWVGYSNLKNNEHVATVCFTCSGREAQSHGVMFSACTTATRVLIKLLQDSVLSRS